MNLSRILDRFRDWSTPGVADLFTLRVALTLLFDLGSPLITEERKDTAEEAEEVSGLVLLVGSLGGETGAVFELDMLERGVVVLEGAFESIGPTLDIVVLQVQQERLQSHI